MTNYTNTQTVTGLTGIENTSNTNLLNINQIANRLGIKQSTVRFLVFKKRIPFTKVGKAVRFSEERINEWLKKNEKLGELL